MNNIKKNYILNLLYQLFSLITPLITTPYISRVLGSVGIGQYSFTYSIVSYFVIFAALGFNTYAQREIARCQGDRKSQTKVFWEIIIARSVSVGLSLMIYFIVILYGVFDDSYLSIMYILSINILSTAFDITFYFQGNENFGIIAIRNIFIKVIGVSIIIVFVKNERHVWLYALCQSIILIISNLSLWTRLPKYLDHISFKDLRIKRHYLPTIRLFAPTIAVSVYTMLDKTLIGIMIPGMNDAGQKMSDLENGYYEQSEKIVKMAMTIITSLGTVMTPRNTKLIADGDYDSFKKNINGAIQFVVFLGTPIMFGLAAIASNFSPWFFGPGYEKVPALIMMFSVLIIIIGLSNVLGIQYLLPMKKDGKYTIAITSGAILNLFLNIFLIPSFWSYGACVATISAELVVTALMFFFARNDISFIIIMISNWKYVVSGLCMFLLVYFTQKVLSATMLNTLILLVEGFVCYLGVLFLLKDELISGYVRIIKKSTKKNGL